MCSVFWDITLETPTSISGGSIHSVTFIICISFSLVSTSLFFQTEGHIKKVEHAKIEAIAKEFHISAEEITVKEKKHHVKNYDNAETTYDVNIKNETLEVVVEHEGFTQYHVVKVSKVLKEKKD